MKPNNKKWKVAGKRRRRERERERVVNVSLYIPPFSILCLVVLFLSLCLRLDIAPFFFFFFLLFFPSLLSQLLLGRVETGTSAHSTLSSGVVHTHSQRRQQTHPDPPLLSPIQAQTYAEKKKGEEEKNNKHISLLVQLFCFHSLPGSVVSPPPLRVVCVYAVSSSFGLWDTTQKQTISGTLLADMGMGTWSGSICPINEYRAPTTTAAVILPYYSKVVSVSVSNRASIFSTPVVFLIHI